MSPRATPTEEPEGGNLLVRIWRGAGVGNLPAYSISHFFPAIPAARLRQRLPSRLGSSHTPSTVAPAVRLGARRSAGLRSLDMQRRMG